MLLERLGKDLKTAMLAGDSQLVEVLKSLKNAVIYAGVEGKSRNQNIDNEQVAQIFRKEAKKRQEAADLYKKNGNQERCDLELKEKEIIEGYLPKMLSEEETAKLIGEVISAMAGPPGPADMGKIIGQVKAKSGGLADGALIAKITKEKLG